MLQQLIKKQFSIYPYLLNSKGTLTVQNENVEGQIILHIRNSIGQIAKTITLNKCSQQIRLNNL